MKAATMSQQKFNTQAAKPQVKVFSVYRFLINEKRATTQPSQQELLLHQFAHTDITREMRVFLLLLLLLLSWAIVLWIHAGRWLGRDINSKVSAHPLVLVVQCLHI
jgi:hypothetical protein